MTTVDIQRRGACPTLSAPMRTGDGLLVRLTPRERRLTPHQLSMVARAAQTLGNGLIEVTSRGNLQIRGLTESGVERLAEVVDSLGIAPADGVPIDISALAGLDPNEIIDARPIAQRLRSQIAARGFVGRVSPKVTIIVDGGGCVPLHACKADIRLTACRDSLWRVEFGNKNIGIIASENVVSAAADLLAAIASRGIMARATDWEVPPFVAKARSGTFEVDRVASRAEIIGKHCLLSASAGGSRFAIGLAPAFGQVHAAQLLNLIEAAPVAEFRFSHGRAIFALDPVDPTSFLGAAERCGFIIHCDDPRRRIAACPGSDGCSSGFIPARRLAERIARLDPPPAHSIHVSGCAKGCAHPRRSDMTIVGSVDGVALVRDGTTRDKPVRQIVSQDAFAAELLLINEQPA